LVYTGVAAVDVYLGATQLRHGDSANMYHPGEFRYGGGHVMEDLVAGKTLQLFALSYGTDCYPLREIRTYFTIDDLNQAIMVNPRNCYQNYNVAINETGKGVTRDQDGCTHCGACVVHCPVRALYIDDSATREVGYEEARCIECLACIRVCPYAACASAF